MSKEALIENLKKASFAEGGWGQEAVLLHKAIELIRQHDGWQPAETAPRDGTPFIANLLDGALCQIVYFDEEAKGDWVWAVEDSGHRYHRNALAKWMPEPPR